MKRKIYTNRLKKELSPYLKQHAHNPVNWYPWSDEALLKAKEENKPIIVSIGYAACHWCHVMEKDCFEDIDVAKVMNENFVCIKVDREERPDIDSVYMSAVQLLTGSGGWPLNVITLPDTKPIYGGTYFPKGKWINLLEQLVQVIKDRPEDVKSQALTLTEGISGESLFYASNNLDDVDKIDIDSLYKAFEHNFDHINGGQKGSPKFPMPSSYNFLLEYGYGSNIDALQFTYKTLEKISNGGIYDQIGGGFSRYSVDEEWKIPHFEKMLYDNALLVSLYSDAYKISKNDSFKTVISETLEFVKRDLYSKKGLFFSSLDADSEGGEGNYYVWDRKEIDEILKEFSSEFCSYYNVLNGGNWEKYRNILYVTDPDRRPEKLHFMKSEILKRRKQRIKPALDNKILTSWNSLMIKAYTDAFKALGHREYKKIALKAGSKIYKKFTCKDGSLIRSLNSNISGFLDDYANVIDSYISLYQITFNLKWLSRADKLLCYVLQHFSDKDNALFYYTSDKDNKLITRTVDVIDNVMPSGNSVMAKNLFILGKYLYKEDYINRSRVMLSRVSGMLLKGGIHTANWSTLLYWFKKNFYVISIIGHKFKTIRDELNSQFLPNALLAGAKRESKWEMFRGKEMSNKTPIYICRDNSCLEPVFSTEEVKKKICQKA